MEIYDRKAMLTSRYDWNCDRPALVSLRYSSVEHRRLDITGLKNYFSTLFNDSPIFRISQDLTKELYIFGKVLYKMNGPFHRHAHFQMAKRLKKLLDKCSVSADSYLKMASSTLRETIASIRLDEKDNLYCPSGEYFRYSLSNLRTLASAFVKVVECCVEFCDRMMHMLNFGHFVQVHCLLLGIVARVRSDCCQRIRLLKACFVDFEYRGYLAAVLQLKCVHPLSADEKEYFVRNFEYLDDIDRILDSDQTVSTENLSLKARKDAIDYFENLFNVRLVEQQTKRQQSGAVKEKKFVTTELDFRQALVGTSMVAQAPTDQDIDLGVPISRAINRDDNDWQTETAISLLDNCLSQMDRAKSIKSMRKVATKWENIEDRRLQPVIRFLRKRLEKTEQTKGNGSKLLSKFVKGVRRKLKRALAE